MVRLRLSDLCKDKGPNDYVFSNPETKITFEDIGIPRMRAIESEVSGRLSR